MPSAQDAEPSMPTLNWIGKQAVVKHHKEVPFRLLEPLPELSLPLSRRERGRGVRAMPRGNLIVQGDNLHALKALLPRYAGRSSASTSTRPTTPATKAGSTTTTSIAPRFAAGWARWSARKGETLDRHDRWLCMMYPRLVLLRQFLREDGAIFVSIDDNEVATLRLLMDEIFGARNFIATVLWQKSLFAEEFCPSLLGKITTMLWSMPPMQRCGSPISCRAAMTQRHGTKTTVTRAAPWASGDLQAAQLLL
jgi:hypothetical protein